MSEKHVTLRMTSNWGRLIRIRDDLRGALQDAQRWPIRRAVVDDQSRDDVQRCSVPIEPEKKSHLGEWMLMEKREDVERRSGGVRRSSRQPRGKGRLVLSGRACPAMTIINTSWK
ncbi:hypothetical protein KCU87_g438, partial [Aureobasidium melanogenum]